MARAEKPSSSAEARSLTDSLRAAAAGSPVLLVLADNVVEARSADGKLNRVIVPGPIQQAIYDGLLDLLWVRRTGAIEVWDLRQAKPKAVPVIAKMSDEGDFSIEMKGDRILSRPGVCVVSGSTELKWQSPPAVKILGFDEGERPNPRLVGTAWLIREIDRPRREVSITRADLPLIGGKPSVVLPARVGKCDDSNECGTAVPFGATGWELIFAGESGGEDCHHFRCLLRDPAANKFGKPPLPLKWDGAPKAAHLGECGLYRFDSSGKWFAIGGKLCAPGGPCNDIGDATPLGWLDGERDIGTSG
ncbi:MAG TPA: hypothetical protein VGL59_04015 [Polyangia bacterium]